MSQQRETAVRADPTTRCNKRVLALALDIEAVELGESLPGLIVLKGRQRSVASDVNDGAAQPGATQGKRAFSATKSEVRKRAGSHS